jgi:hypothetical protein
MPGCYQIEPKNSLVISQAWGILTDAELLAHARQLGADPKFRGLTRQLAVLTDVTDALVNQDSMRELVKASPWGEGARRAVVAGSELVFGMARMYELLNSASSDEFQVFRDLTPAIQWLGLPSDWVLPARDKADVYFEVAHKP